MHKTVIAVSMAAMAWAQSAAAQPVPTSLYVLVEDVDAAGSACGLTAEVERSAIRSSMRYNRISESTDPDSTPEVYVNTNTLQISGGLCVTSYMVSIRQFVPADAPRPYGEFMYCEEGGLLSGANHGNRVSGSIKTAFDRCLSRIQDKAAAIRPN
jgi:hypothetical protein